MDSKSIGKTIAFLRKRSGLTQSELTERLNVSNQAVRKRSRKRCSSSDLRVS